MAGWKGLGQMPKSRVRRVDLGDTVRWRGEGPLRVRGVMAEGQHIYVLLDLDRGPCWVPSADCDLVAPKPALVEAI